MTPETTCDVALLGTAERGYPARPPFDPPEAWPELAGSARTLDPGNRIYAAVRECLRLLDLDAGRFGTPAWNPLGSIVTPGDRVCLKPNMVRHFHGEGGSLDALVTHGSVVRALLDYVLIALKGEGRVLIGDAPLQYADFGATAAATGIDEVVRAAAARTPVPVSLVDFRRERSEKRGGLIVSRVPNHGDPEGYREVDLGARSRFHGIGVRRAQRFRVTQYDPRAMARAHAGRRHAYLLPQSLLACNVLINIPKLKTHRKAGLTAAMKNLVGINGSKDWLPHHTTGSTRGGGDEYRGRSARKAIISALRDRLDTVGSARRRAALHAVERIVRATGRLVPFPDPYWEGSWHGNDTLWRMVHDLHHVIFFADAAGDLHETPVRRYFCLVDAIVAGEGEGPMRPTPRAEGVLLAGTNPAAVDAVAARLIGFDPHRIPLLRHTMEGGFHPPLPGLDAIRVRTNRPDWIDLFRLPAEATLRFKPPSGWAGAVEYEAPMRRVGGTR